MIEIRTITLKNKLIKRKNYSYVRDLDSEYLQQEFSVSEGWNYLPDSNIGLPK